MDKQLSKDEIDELALHYGWTVREKQRVIDYVKQTAIAFGEFLNNNNFTPDDLLGDTWKKLYDKNISYTADQLYELFLQSTKQ